VCLSENTISSVHPDNCIVELLKPVSIYNEGYSHQEIGTSLGMSELLSRTTLHRARTALKEMIGKLTTREEHCYA
jgi:hypothetical protein